MSGVESSIPFWDRHFGELITGVGLLIGGLTTVVIYIAHRQWKQNEHGNKLKSHEKRHDGHDERFKELEEKWIKDLKELEERIFKEMQEIKTILKDEADKGDRAHDDLQKEQFKQGKILARLEGKLESK